MSSSLASEQARPADAAAAHDHRFRPDIEGLRAVAVLTVIGYHAGLPFLSGGYVGVDVFFVISGFLITGMLATEAARSGRISLPRFYARRIRRLLPAVAVVLVVVAALSVAILGPLRRVDAGGDIVASGLYVANWRFGAQAVDYLAADAAPSPVLHFWSLAVEEQFYVVWPLLLLIVTAAARRAGRSLTRPLLLAMAAVFVPSLLWSIHLTATSAGWAYYSTLTRAWELALGGGLAMVLPLLRRLPELVAAVLGWLGLAGVLVAAVTFTSLTPFPGTAALLPTLGTAAVLAAGVRGPTPLGAGRVLATAAFRHVGRLSYSWYLWHWPFLVFAAAIVGTELSPWAGLLVVALAYVPSWLTHRYVEEPFRRSAVLVRLPRRAYALAAGCTALAVVAGLGLAATGPRTGTVAPGAALGAAALAPEPSRGVASPGSSNGGQPTPRPAPSATFQESADAVVPSPADALSDIPALYSDGCHRSFEDVDPGGCVFGDPDADRTLVLYGDSHAAMWFPAIEPMARAQGWRLVVLTKSGCPAADFEPYNATINRGYSECTTWHGNALERIAQEHPTTVLVAQTTGYAQAVDGERVPGDQAQPALAAGLERTLRDLLPLAGNVVLMRDTPSPPISIPDCVAEHMDQLRECGFPKSVGLEPGLPDVVAAAAVPAVTLIDLDPWVCPGKVCAPVIGDVLVYRDEDHITATYATSMIPLLRERLVPLMNLQR